MEISDNHGNIFDTSKTFELDLPKLSSFTYGPLPDLSALDASSVSSSPDLFEFPDVREENIWSFSEADESEQKRGRFRSWEAFYDNGSKEPNTVYISEGGPQVFDAVIAAAAEKTKGDDVSLGSGRVIQSGPLLSCLHQLGLGRESLLYSYDRGTRSFYPCIEDGRMTGYSLETFQSLTAAFIDQGNKIAELHSFIDQTQASSGSSPAMVALAGSFSSLLVTLQADIGEAARSVHSLLQLQSLFDRPRQLGTLLFDLRRNLGATTTDEELLSTFYKIVSDSEPMAGWLRTTLFHIFQSVSRPWLESAGGWLGLEANSVIGSLNQCPNFVKVNEEARKDGHGKGMTGYDYDLELRSMPNLLASEDVKTLFESGRNLRLLGAHQPRHPLFERASSGLLEFPELEWCSSWDDVDKVQVKAKDYECSLRKAIDDFNLHGERQLSQHSYTGATAQCEPMSNCLSEEAAKAYISASIASFEEPLPRLHSEVGNMPLFTSFQERPRSNITSEGGDFSPPISLLPVLSFNPLISSQAHLINHACLRLLFREHNLRSHFSLLHRYSLFGDGVFASRLSHALFDPELPTAERRKGRSRAGISGLKLGSRDNWPPASSELRLALMGILIESYHDTGKLEASSLFRNDLPGGLSFAIRDMSEEELKRCMDPNSIEALDFLRLHYDPPPPLNAVITQSSLLRYDAVFKLLLRTLRVLFVANQLFQDTKHSARRSDYVTQRFRIESHHFTLAISNYLFDGVQANWNILERKLKDSDRELDRNSTESLSDLRDFHEQLLDRMMFTLILRKRQAQVMKLLEDIFSLILQFARCIRSEASGLIEEVDGKTDIRQIYEKFNKKVRVFIHVCRGLSERRGQGGLTMREAHQDVSNGDEIEDGGNTIGQLLLKFEMSGFYVP